MALIRRPWLWGVAMLVVAAGPLLLPGDFKGSDDKATELITHHNPDYHPWMTPVWTPPSDEIASLLFALQAGIGAGVLGYIIGYRRGRQQR